MKDDDTLLLPLNLKIVIVDCDQDTPGPGKLAHKAHDDMASTGVSGIEWPVAGERHITEASPLEDPPGGSRQRIHINPPNN